MLVADILRVKGSHVITVRPDETIATFAHRLRLEAVGAMIVSGFSGPRLVICIPRPWNRPRCSSRISEKASALR